MTDDGSGLDDYQQHDGVRLGCEQGIAHLAL
jgi:hypothetical protein